MARKGSAAAAAFTSMNDNIIRPRDLLSEEDASELMPVQAKRKSLVPPPPMSRPTAEAALETATAKPPPPAAAAARARVSFQPPEFFGGVDPEVHFPATAAIAAMSAVRFSEQISIISQLHRVDGEMLRMQHKEVRFAMLGMKHIGLTHLGTDNGVEDEIKHFHDT